MQLSKDLPELVGDRQPQVNGVFQQAQALVSFLMVKNMYQSEGIETT